MSVRLEFKLTLVHCDAFVCSGKELKKLSNRLSQPELDAIMKKVMQPEIFSLFFLLKTKLQNKIFVNNTQ